MALTQQQKDELMAGLAAGDARKAQMVKERVIPESYKAWMQEVDREETVLTVPDCEVPVRVIINRAKHKKPDCPIHINCHGGGFVTPQNQDDDLYCAHVAAGIRGIVVDIDYAVLPDHPFPIAFNQVWGVIAWVFEQAESWGADRKHISLGGNSAGGCLVTAAALKNGKTKDFSFELLIPQYAANDNYMAVLPDGNPRSRIFSLLYAEGDEELLKDPYVSPAFAPDEDLAAMPRTLFIAAQNCPFTPVNDALAMRMAAQGVLVGMKRYLNSNHGFLVRMGGDEWPAAQQLVIDSINELQ